MAKASATSGIHFVALAPSGPAAAYHTGCIINGGLYIHGGIDKKFNKDPLRSLHRLDLETGLWHEVRAPNCPALSHHASLVLHNRYLVLVGGWDGKVRTSNVCAFDTEESRWIFPKTSGFPTGAGLSSHTATLLADGSILVVGREGSTRMQRRSGNAYMLTGDIARGSFVYRDMAMGVASRSGHSCHILGGMLIILGGRADNMVELHSGFHAPPHPHMNIMDKLASCAKSLPSLPKPLGGRKHHASAAGSGVVFVHGGETFDGRNREPVGEMYILHTKPHCQWHNARKTLIGRAGHVCCVVDDKLIIHGGEAEKGAICGSTYQIDASSL